MDVGPAQAEIARHAGRVVVGEDADADWESRVLALLDDSRHLVPEHVGDLAVHVPCHQLAGT
jgi:hypothetical protein